MMDNPWRSKCSSPWTPPPPFQAEETAPVPVPGTSGNQMEINRRHNFLPFAFHEAGLEEHTLIGKPGVSCNTGNMEIGKSFLALLSGGHSFSLPSDFQSVLNFESSGASRRVSANASTTAVNSMNSGFSLAHMAYFSGYDTNKITGNRVEHSYVTSEPLSTFRGSQVPTFQVNLQSADAPLHNSSSSKEVVQQDLGEGTDEAVLSLKKGWPVDTVPVNFKKNHNSTVRPSRVILSEAKYGHQERVSALSGKRPRVFCMGTSGQLLLSDTGLLGIVCLCHNLHMSVAKFCEHSGARAANPGDAVQLESGETIVQWRKMFFIMIGIRVPDDGNGWDWPEGISVFGGMDRSHANILPNLTKNTNTFQSACINGSSRFDEPWKNLVSDNRPHKERTAMEKLCNMIPNGQQRNPSEGCKPSIKSFMGYTHGACSFASNFISHTMEEFPDRDSMPIMNTAAKGERNSGNCFVAEHIDLSANDGNQFSSNPCSKTMESFGVAPIINRCSISGDNFMDRNATSSNIELRLGQPSQCSPALGSPVSVAMRSQLLQAPFDLKKPHLSFSPTMTEEAMQNLWHNSSSSSSLNRRDWCHASGSFNATDPSEHAQPKGDATKSALISQFHSNYKVSEGNLPSLATSCIGNKSEGIISKVLNGESVPPNCIFTDFSGNTLNGMKEKSSGNVPDPCNKPGVEIDSRNVADSCSYAIVNPNGMMFHNRQMVDPRLCSASFGGQCSLRSSNLNDTKIHSPSHWPYAMMTSVSEMREFSQCRSGSCHGNGIHDIVSQRSVNAMPTVGSRLLSSTTPANQSLPNSNLASDSLSALKNKEPIDVSQHLVDEKMRSFALKNKVISSKQDHGTSLVMDFEQGRHCCISMETQRKGISTPLHEAKQVPYQSIERDASAVPLQSLHSCSNCYSNSILEKLGFFMGRNNCNCTTSVQGISSHFKEREVLCPPIHVYGVEEQSSLRTGRINSDACDQVDHRSCYQKERNICPSAMCSHAATSKLSPGSYIHGAERPFISCVEHIENAIGKSPLLFTSACDQNHLSQGGRISSLGQYDGNRCILANNDFHSAQWKDVPRRLIGNADDNSVGSPLVALEDKETIKSQLIEGNAKANDATSRVAGCLRGQQTSDFCSGMSAPAPTDVSVEVDNMESIGDAVAEAKSMDIIDEGSRIEKCGSSDEAPVSRMWEEDLALTNKVDSIKPSSENLPIDSSHPSHDVKLMKTSKMKKVKKQDRIPEMVKHAQEYRKLRKIEKRKRATKWKRLDASFSAAGCSAVYHDSMDFHTESHGALSEGMELILQPDNLEKRGLTSFTGHSGVKRKRSLLSLAKSLSWKGCEDLQRKDDDAQTQPKSNGLSIGKHKSPVGKKNESTADGTSLIWKEEVCEISGKIPKCSALDCLKSLSNTGGETFNKKMKPIVCGTMGIITNGNLGGKQKQPKIVSLRSILKTAKRCTIVEGERGQPTILETKETCFCKNKKFCNECSNSKEKKDSIVLKNVGETGYLSMSMRSKACFNQNKGVDEQFAQKEMHDVSHETGGPNNHHYAKKPKQKETRKRSLGELTGKSKHAKNMRCLPHLGERKHPQLREADFPLKQSMRNCSDDDNNDNNSNSIRFRARKFLKSILQSDSMVCEESLKSAKDIQECMTDLHQLYLKRNSMEVRRLEPIPLDSDAFCCVCGGSSNDEVNQLLKCNHCLIKVHQACYGVSKMPKGHWYCRPCKSNSKNIVCVLCGYEGGAMTKALRSHNIVKSLLKAWKVETGSTPMGPISLCESVCDELHTLDFVRGSTEIKESSSSSIVKPTNVNKFPDDVMKLHPLPHTEGPRICDSMSNTFQVYNTITAGVFDPSVMQWVHMVCGLWTPGTRCPNVDTMNAFDVSGASPPRKNIVCSMCNRPGGSCIRCRVVNCSIHFHPWCAHQKGLLQSENEGPDDESVGFYGRCMLHATSVIPTESCFTDNDLRSTQREEFTCARTEGYKGRKSEDGFSNTHCGRSGDGGGCLVPQEQINAWLHINGQKSCTRPIKSLDLDVEHDCRKEYSRYKQAKGWKKLVVYKSGIHALGLYTSRFISRGAMVVEYVGEIVGPRVADKREIEYQSGSKLQYKSACYFFRIDKEHIIDATRKGGIARFVNHSCLPNCVAKVVTVRNEKKVVFFAERDINPGEEITYDYHFNHEDEGKKIPCFCRSRNCRRYLN